MRGNRAKPAGNRVDIKIEHCHCRRRKANGNHQPGQLRCGAAKQHDHDQRHQCNDCAGHGDAAGSCPQDREFRQEICRHLSLNAKAEEICDLTGGNDDRNADGKPVYYRFGNVTDQASSAKKAGNQQDEAGHEGCNHQPVIAVIGNHRVDHHDEGAGWSADLDPATAQCGNRQAGNNGGDQPDARIGARGNGNRHRQGQCHHRHG
jgi:hypothetical protein